jgi:hypothetical protein
VCGEAASTSRNFLRCPGERHNERAGAGDHRDRQALSDAAAHECEARITDAGRAGVADERHVTTLREQIDDAVARLAFVVLVERDLRLVNLKALEQLAGVARILGGDEVNRAQRVECAGADVAQIADGGGDQVEHGGFQIFDFRFQISEI